ncbi:hypothetical protein AWF45_16200 [Escherichia coli]|nr:hypothetical protein AWF45_16200 [Escherichia coli]
MPIHDKSPRPQEFAAVDLGSNSFHMVIARVVDGAMQIIGRLKQRVHLADGLGPDNMLSEEAMTRGFFVKVPGPDVCVTHHFTVFFT